MPVIVDTPAQGEAIGPGTIIRASTFAVLPPGHHWDALVFEAGKQDTLAEAITFVEGQSADFTLGVRTLQPSQLEPIFSRQPAVAAEAGEFTLTVRVISAQSTIIDTSGPIGVIWRPDPWGTAFVQSLQAQSTGTGEGFTEQDRVVLGAINSATIVSLPLTTLLPTAAGLALSLFPKQPPIDFLAEGEELLLTGRGSITRASGSTGVYAYGGRWEVVAKPPGLGKLDGAITKYEQRIIQIVVIKNRLGGGLYASETIEADFDAGEMSWPIPFPVRIDYDVLPGVTVRWRWLLFLQAPPTS